MNLLTDLEHNMLCRFLMVKHLMVGVAMINGELGFEWIVAWRMEYC
jgi:hypothetical protein